MKVLVTGATGTLGSAVVPELVTAGHEVRGLARSSRSAAAVTALGATPLHGSLADPDLLRDAAREVDAVIHLAFSNDFGRLEEGIAEEAAAVRALGEGLTADGAGEGRAFVVAAGTPAVPGRTSTEEDPMPAEGPVAGRAETAQHVLDLARLGVRSAAVRLPRSVHRAGVRYGFASILIEAARRSGASGYVGDGSQRWPAVHVLDAARLFRLVLEQAAPGTVAHAVADEGDPMREIAQTIGDELALPTREVPAEDFGVLGGIFAVDQPSSSAITRERFGWTPQEAGLIEELRLGGYPA
ncbi:SDR family oxidoreductase [Brachybacterium sp. NBEC-018]|uniref:SDR family oxidoreductase n=1 Tax=Brachybacterium sp. NBEC-018 TaxID=2996004 RepID=UPI002174FBE8|nr:SDR family oxidoreductase [Brachybacterium sp. NBEC-018]UVY84626.1 SDR family oxidoreductase [Brachybacterium sp. NBEC-018]